MSNLIRRWSMMARWAHWLTGAACQTILTAFGSDGQAVINAVNEYLSLLSGSSDGKQRARALAVYLNEDPMMVCSLGLEVEGVTMPIRWLYSSGTGYILDDSLYLNGSMRIETKIIWDGYKGTYDHCVYGPNNNSGSGGTDEYCRYLLLASGGSGRARFVYSSFDDNVAAPSVNTPIVIVDNAGTLYYDGVVKKTNTQRAFTCRSPFGIFYVWGGGRANGIKMTYLKITDNGVAIREFVPFISKTQGCGFLDLTNLVFYPNRVSGEGKDFTIPDISYTPSTP